MLEALGHRVVDGEDDGESLLAVQDWILIAVEDDNTALLRLTDAHAPEVEVIGGKAQVVCDANGKLLHQGLFRGDAGADEGEGYTLPLTTPSFGHPSCLRRGIHDGARFFKLTALAARVEAEGNAGGVGRGDGFILGEVDGGTATGSVALYQSDVLAAAVAEPERVFLYAVRLLDRSQGDGGHADNDQRVNDQHISCRPECRCPSVAGRACAPVGRRWHGG